MVLAAAAAPACDLLCAIRHEPLAAWRLQRTVARPPQGAIALAFGREAAIVRQMESNPDPAAGYRAAHVRKAMVLTGLTPMKMERAPVF